MRKTEGTTNHSSGWLTATADFNRGADAKRTKVVGGNRRRHSREDAGGAEIGCRAAPSPAPRPGVGPRQVIAFNEEAL